MAQAATTPTLARRRGSGLARQEAFFGYLFLLPWLIGRTVFVVGPMLAALGLSFTPYSLGRPIVFNGAANYVRAFTFFFQAEDGIRGLYVTGVQTCALPISSWSAAWAMSSRWRSECSGPAMITRSRSSWSMISMSSGASGTIGTGPM